MDWLTRLTFSNYFSVLLLSSGSAGAKASEAAVVALNVMEERSSTVATMLMSMQGVKVLRQATAMEHLIKRLRFRERATYRTWRIRRAGPQMIRKFKSR